MKVKIKDIYPNPNRDDKFDSEQLKALEGNMKELELMGAIPAVKRGNKIHQVSHHHRLKLLRKLKGDNHEVEVVIHDYDDDQLFRGMVIENLTQKQPFQRKSDEILSIVTYLNKNKEVLNNLRKSTFRDSQKVKQKHDNRPKGKATAEDIKAWLKINKKDFSWDEINSIINIAHRLDPELQDQIERTHEGPVKGRRNGGVLNITQARLLTTIEDKEEQKDLAKALRNSSEQRVRDQSKLMAKYKKAPEFEKEAVRSGERDIAHIIGEGAIRIPFSEKSVGDQMSTLICEVNKCISGIDSFTGDETVLREVSYGEIETLIRNIFNWRQSLCKYGDRVVEQAKAFADKPLDFKFDWNKTHEKDEEITIIDLDTRKVTKTTRGGKQ